MKTMKRSIALALSLIMILSLSVTAQAAYKPKHTEKAETLYELGLFKGTGTNADGTPIFSLQNKATRLQALIILIRLLGLEEEALATTEVNPFTDIPSGGVGEKYAAYAYSVGLTKGVSADKFGNSDVTPAQFATFVLRALGYSDTRVADAIAKGREIGLISSDLTLSGKTMLRDECVAINYSALKCKLKDSQTTLLDKLLADGAVTSSAVANSGIMNSEVVFSFTKGPGPEGHPSIFFKTADILGAFPAAKYLSYDSSGVFTRQEHDKCKFSLESIWMNTAVVRHVLQEGSSDVVPLTSLEEAFIRFESSSRKGLRLAVLDEDYNMLGYCIIPPAFDMESTTLTFTKIPVFNGMEAYERLIASMKDIKQPAPDGLYCEKIITKHADGTEEIKLYLRVDESKCAAELKGFKYYTLQSGGDKDAWLRFYSDGAKDLSIKTLGVDTLPGKGDDKDNFNGTYLYVLNDEKVIVASIAMPYRLPTVETIIEK